MPIIYHIVSSENWAKFAGQPGYEADSLQTEGFIHLSEQHQIAGVLERYYQNTPDLLLLHIDPAKLTPELRYEEASNGDRFPHLYGPIDREAILHIAQITTEKTNG